MYLIEIMRIFYDLSCWGNNLNFFILNRSILLFEIIFVYCNKIF